jgi:predicted transcriptional regulator of viral defense system
LDTLNNETTVYPSISEAAQSIGCAHSTIRNALKHLQEKGVSRLLKKRYLVKIITD